jgi:hypothetical protein
MNKRMLAFLCTILMASPGLVAIGSADETTSGDTSGRAGVVPQFGSGFDETIIADSSDDLNVPRDLEFHPGSSRSDELWIVNRATDSVTIIHNTGLSTQWSEHREDSNRNHFMEEVSAIAFGAYDSEFDVQFVTAQESRNTFNGQGSPNNFMGPALWPSSLSHFAVENQDGGPLLGSHIDMLHESPYGMGVAHDSGNAYWYYDGYYGDLVYYDFQEDHDTGEDDHSDGIVRRYSEVSLSRSAGTPSHMVLDKDSGILYIADSGAGRVLWVDTDDPSTTSANLYNSNTRMEPLHEYSSITGVSWGVLASGMSRPSGIALDGDTLFVSTNGNGQIRAYDLGTTPTTATLLQTVDTTASKIMGLEIGPDGKLYYVDGGRNKVIRLDTYPDADEDGVRDSLDNCLNTANSEQENHDLDLYGDVCDDDDDGDGVLDDLDMCRLGLTAWTSSNSTDYDGDGCHDTSEDSDDDGDSIEDFFDDCKLGELNWLSDSIADHDSDGCQDSSEDLDDDADGICDADVIQVGCIKAWPEFDRCPLGRIGFMSNQFTDKDHDGCEDIAEDTDDDDDGHNDLVDICPDTKGTAIYGQGVGCPDFDGDGWADLEDVFISEPTQWNDTDRDGYGDEADGVEADGCPLIVGSSMYDRFGCADADEDGYSNPSDSWTASDGADAFPSDSSQWNDSDSDSYGDNVEGFQPDSCPQEFGTSTEDRFGCVDSDADGYSDHNDAFPTEVSQWLDEDGDGYGNNVNGVFPDSCPTVAGTSTEDRYGCLDSDSDTWSDDGDYFPNNATLWGDMDRDGYADQTGTELSDDCPEEWGNSTGDRLGCLDSDGDGISNDKDFYPQDSSRSVLESEDSSIMKFILGGVALTIISLLLVLVIRSKKSTMPNLTQQMMPVPMPNMNAPIIASQPVYTAPAPVQLAGPPLPFEGLPPGWTMEQWQHYGQSWLEQNGRV